MNWVELELLFKINESPFCGSPVGIKARAKAWSKKVIFGLRVKSRCIVRINSG